MYFSGTCAAWKDGLLPMLTPSPQSVGTRFLYILPLAAKIPCLDCLFNIPKHVQEELLPGGHGLMVRGYRPVINTLSKGIDIRLGHR